MNAGLRAGIWSVLLVAGAPLLVSGQSVVHGRKYQAPAQTGRIIIQVQKAYNDSPLENAAVIFNATKDGKDNGNLEIKTNSQGKAVMDLLEAGSHVRVQVIARGYATAAQELDLTDTDQNLMIKMQRPREQVSMYTDNDGKAATAKPGIQEPEHQAPKAARATTASLSGTLKDEHGGRIPGGVVRLHAVSGGADVSQATDAEGNFRFDRVVPGTYELRMSAPGKTEQTRRNLVLGAGDSQIYKETLHTAADAAANRSLLPQPAGAPR